VKQVEDEGAEDEGIKTEISLGWTSGANIYDAATGVSHAE
jgi:hypothetical protein